MKVHWKKVPPRRPGIYWHATFYDHPLEGAFWEVDIWHVFANELPTVEDTKRWGPRLEVPEPPKEKP